MSYEVKYIGMDVHKEAIVIAVLNEGGKLVMESVIETKASSILQFLHGLRGEPHVTWEEGTWVHGRNPINGNERELIEDARRNLYFLKKHPAA